MCPYNNNNNINKITLRLTLCINYTFVLFCEYKNYCYIWLGSLKILWFYHVTSFWHQVSESHSPQYWASFALWIKRWWIRPIITYQSNYSSSPIDIFQSYSSIESLWYILLLSIVIFLMNFFFCVYKIGFYRSTNKFWVLSFWKLQFYLII